MLRRSRCVEALANVAGRGAYAHGCHMFTLAVLSTYQSVVNADTGITHHLSSDSSLPRAATPAELRVSPVIYSPTTALATHNCTVTAYCSASASLACHVLALVRSSSMAYGHNSTLKHCIRARAAALRARPLALARLRIALY